MTSFEAQDKVELTELLDRENDVDLQVPHENNNSMIADGQKQTDVQKEKIFFIAMKK